MRYFYEEYPEIHIVAAGSLFDFVLKDIESFQVKRVECLYLHPFISKDIYSDLNTYYKGYLIPHIVTQEIIAINDYLNYFVDENNQ